MEFKWYQVCPMKKFDENIKLDKKWIDNYCNGNWKISSGVDVSRRKYR